jgi:hypothetical protein
MKTNPKDFNMHEIWRSDGFFSLGKKRWYKGIAQSVHTMYPVEFLIDADMFDKMSPEQQKIVYEKEHDAASQTSIVQGGGWPD